MTQKCIKCKDFSDLFLCNECQQSFSDEHREELSHKMDNINKEYRYLDEDLNENNLIQSYLSRIDEWEYESINKI